MKVTKSTDIEESDKNIEVEKVAAVSTSFGKIITLDEVSATGAFQRVICEVKVLSVGVGMEVNGGKHKQDIVIGDSTGKAKLTLWESEIDTLQENMSYRLNGMIVREFKGKFFLSTSKENSNIEVIDDIGMVAEVDNDDVFTIFDKLKSVRIVGVETLDSYSGCMKCNGKVISDVEESELGICGRCGMMQCTTDCKKEITAQLRVKFGGGIICLRAFGKILEEIAGGLVDRVSLLKAGVFNIEHHDGVIRSVTR